MSMFGGLLVIGMGWYQGLVDFDLFLVQVGYFIFYVVFLYKIVLNGGVLLNWFIMLIFLIVIDVQISFWVCGVVDFGYFDFFFYGLFSGSSDSVVFSLWFMVVVLIGDWIQVMLGLLVQGVGIIGCLVIVYSGLVDILNYIGIDMLIVIVVLELQIWLLIVVGLVVCVVIVCCCKSVC